MQVHLDPIVYTVRLYEGDNTFENRDDFCAVMTIEVMDDTCFMFGMHGKINKEHWIKLLTQLKNLGVKTIISKRHKRVKGNKIYDVEKYLAKLTRSE